ncbi:asparagine synthase (glutamine-hydrolyzing), partial [Candidatus Gottesmanbacteria bacterium]|nr:asparagine synthase (glutamine-hydrolyzing) [Candidatus Gottesmanbacteria bacterium]
MCGVSGFINFNGDRPSLGVLGRMTDVLSYRGPDGRGLVIADQCALGSRRLAVIDLSQRAHQPLWDAEHTHCIVYNGEIYNYQTLRIHLKKKGYRFRSDSDTEVIVTLYKAYGWRAVEKLEGMFAFAIWDRRKKELFLGRDRFGIKPLHYYIDDDVFIFASEIKSIILHPNVRKIVNPTALSHYFSLGFGCVASPQTIFSSIFKLPPGHMAIVSGKKIQVKMYANGADVGTEAVSEEEAVEQTRRLLTASVSRQMVSDVPLGVFLSGGIDSSLVASLAQRTSPKPVKTFSMGFTHRRYDESLYARAVA